MSFCDFQSEKSNIMNICLDKRQFMYENGNNKLYGRIKYNQSNSWDGINWRYIGGGTS